MTTCHPYISHTLGHNRPRVVFNNSTLTALEDQQIAGLVMWVGGGGAYLLLAMAMLWRALGADARPLTASRPA